MFHRVMIAALAIGATGGASIAVAEHVLSQPAHAAPAPAPQRTAAVGKPCLASELRVYFAPGADQVDSTSREVLRTAAQQVEGCERLDIAVAAQRSDAERDLRTTARRTASVVSALREEGVTGPVAVADPKTDPAFEIASPGPSYIEVALAPSNAQLVSEARRPTRF